MASGRLILDIVANRRERERTLNLQC